MLQFISTSSKLCELESKMEVAVNWVTVLPHIYLQVQKTLPVTLVLTASLVSRMLPV
jgi:hypothetical protein